MFVKNLSLQNFRNLKSLDLNLNQGFVVIAGPNGAGKTNLLEALYFGLNLRRFPESKLGQLFSGQENFFRIAIYGQNQEAKKFEIFYERTNGYTRKLAINSQVVPRIKFAGTLPAISFIPQDLSLLTRSPSGRRRFLDETLSLVFREYRYNLSQYLQALRQCCELLEKIEQGEQRAEELLIWETKLQEYGKEITQFREKFLNFVNSNIEEAIFSLFPDLSGISAVYDKGQGGPHLDDFRVVFEGQPVVGYFSRGQLRAITLALKILEKKYLEENLKIGAILLLDDVFSEFDHEHQKKLLEFLKGFEQVFVTTAHPEEIEKFLPPDAQTFQINQGVIENV